LESDRLISISDFFNRNYKDKLLLATVEDILLAKSLKSDDWYIICYKTKVKYTFGKNEANLIFRDYLNQVVYSNSKPKLNIDLK